MTQRIVFNGLGFAGKAMAANRYLLTSEKIQ
ncbi:hypothetical protein Ga0123461_0895 [Mariprofundus aestuarium]|uniref:Uncharacterized protein n=1 Tax=Mariprofundus aestuarium TaxID=1921086 RepID=A0A2K8KWP1_MARES|nr:hypothetical protein Ga0123461_0895 [Mariprofundus aestuarium]